MALPGKTEAGSAGKQPCRGIARRAHRDDDHGRGSHLSRSSQSPIGSIDPDALKIPARRAPSTLTRSAHSPVPAEPGQGDISEVYGAASHRTWKLDDVEDHAVALLRNSAGKTATIEAAWNEWRGYRFSIEAYGDRGMVRASYAPMFAMAVYLDKPGVVRRRKYHLYPRALLREQWYGWQSTVRAAFIEEFRDFLRLTQGESSPCADGVAGLRAVEIAQAVYQSNAERRPVSVGTAD